MQFPRPSWRALFSVMIGCLLMGGALVPLTAAPAAAADINVTNGSFGQGTGGWRALSANTGFKSVAGGSTGRSARIISSQWQSKLGIEQSAPAVGSSSGGATYRVSAKVKTSRGMRVVVGFREQSGSRSRLVETGVWVSADNWTTIRRSMSPQWQGSTLTVQVKAVNAPANSMLRVDDVALTGPAGSDPDPDDPGANPSGCTLSQRGIPACRALVGAAVGLNDNPSAFENSVGGTLGMRRTYFNAGRVSGAVSTARSDLAAGRVPWISFKFPHSWRDMANGRGDAWARNIADRLAQLDGPVWVAFHHEPETEGNIAQWRAAQTRLAPIVRNRAPNVAYSIVVTGWHQFHGDTAQYGFDKIWPNTKIDLVGIDVYNYYGVRPKSVMVDMRTKYFEPMARVARARNVAWAVGETGISDVGFRTDNQWLSNTYRDFVAAGGVGWAYFQSNASSALTDWRLDTASQRSAFGSILTRSARLR